MGLFGKIFKAPPPPPPSSPPPERKGSFGGGAFSDEYGSLLTSAQTDSGPFPKTMRLRAGVTSYDLYGSWHIVSWNSAAEYAEAKDKVIQGYYKQFGIKRLPGGAETIRWNEMTWRGVREQLQILYDPKFVPSGSAAQ